MMAALLSRFVSEQACTAAATMALRASESIVMVVMIAGGKLKELGMTFGDGDGERLAYKLRILSCGDGCLLAFRLRGPVAMGSKR